MGDVVKLYIAGPMTGKPEYNRAAFERSRERWSFMGHTVATPFDANSVVWRRHHGRDFDPTCDKCDYGDPLLNEMVAEDLAVLCRADGIVLLDGWKKSRGARAELLIAINLGKKIFLDGDSSCAVPVEISSSMNFRINYAEASP